MISGGELKEFLAMQEREKELETDLKEMADACLAKQCKIVELEAELSTLREHQGMVGKKLTKGSICIRRLQGTSRRSEHGLNGLTH